MRNDEQHIGGAEERYGGNWRAHGGSTSHGSGWRPIDLGAVLNGDQLDTPPAILRRRDGAHLLYAGKLHALYGEPEAGKGWLALVAAVEQIHAGHSVVFADFEDTEHTLVARLRALGADEQAVRKRLTYMRPTVPLEGFERRALEERLEQLAPTLVVLDGLTEAFAIAGRNISDNGDVARWLRDVPRRFAQHGAAVLMVDHVTKDRESRGRYAIGAQHKTAGVDVAYSLEVLEPFGRGREGRARLTVTKDRHGHVRGLAADKGHVAELRMASNGEHATVTLGPPTVEAPAGPSDKALEATWRAIAASPGASKRRVREAVGANNEATDTALAFLIDGGYVEATRDGQAIRHRVARAWPDQPDRAHVPEPCPNLAQSTVGVDRAHVPAPKGAVGTGHIPAATSQQTNDGHVESEATEAEFDLADRLLAEHSRAIAC